METIYCAHPYQGDISNIRKSMEILHDLQITYPDVCYVSPLLVFASLKYGELGREIELNLCRGLIDHCDSLLVMGRVTDGVAAEICYASEKHIPIHFLGKDYF